jgi:hypothetical protein
MTRRQRAFHRLVWPILGLLIVTVLIAGLSVRQAGVLGQASSEQGSR